MKFVEITHLGFTDGFVFHIKKKRKQKTESHPLRVYISFSECNKHNQVCCWRKNSQRQGGVSWLEVAKCSSHRYHTEHDHFPITGLERCRKLAIMLQQL